MGIFDGRMDVTQRITIKDIQSTISMENSSTKLGPKGLIKKHEFIRVLVQCLYSLGYKTSASCLELESGIQFKSVDFCSMESEILRGNWDRCVEIINAISDWDGEIRSSALFLIFKQRLLEFLSSGKELLALDILRKQVQELCLSKEKVTKLACSMLSLDVNKMDDCAILRLREQLVLALETLLPPSIALPERRLEHLVETALSAQVDECMYHNSCDTISLYEDHSCDRDEMPTETVQILKDHKNEVWFVQFSNNGEYLASSSSDCTAIIWKVMDDGKLTLMHTLRSHQNPVSFVAWSPDDTKLLTCGNAEVLKLWDVETGTCRRTFGDNGFTVSSCAWFPDSKRLVCGSSDPEKGIYLRDCDGNEMKAWRGMRMPKVLDLAMTPNGKNLITVFCDKEIRILNLDTNAERVISEEHPITSLSVSADSESFIVNLNSQEIHLWDVAGNKENPIAYLGHKQHKYVIRSCFGGLNSAFIASGSENSQVFIWNRQWQEPLEVLSGHSMTVNCVSWNPKRLKMLASASDDHTIRIWGPRQAKNVSPRKQLKRPQNTIPRVIHLE